MVLATPVCEPTPPHGIAEHSQHASGDALGRAIAQWWALGDADAVVVTADSTYGYTAWLRARRSFSARGAADALDVVLPAHEWQGEPGTRPGTSMRRRIGDDECPALHDQVEW